MGSFSWNRADDLGDIENIYGDCAFKFLIPKEFGGGFIKDKYQDYGNLGTRELPYPNAPSNKYDMYELLAFWNADKVVPQSTESKAHYKKFEVGVEVTIKIGEYDKKNFTDEALAFNGRKFIITGEAKQLKKGLHKHFYLDGDASGFAWSVQYFDPETWYEPMPVAGLLYDGDVMPTMPEISNYTCHNRTLGIYLCHEEVKAERKRREEQANSTGGVNYFGKEFDSGSWCVDQGDFLKYPLKLVSVGFKGTYEDCVGFSRHDPDQGLRPRKRRK